MAKTPALILALLLAGCSKENTGKHTIEMQIANSFHDSVLLSIENLSDPSLSTPAKKLSPNGTGSGALFYFTAHHGDRIKIKGTILPKSKCGRHPLLQNPVAYDTTLAVEEGNSISFMAPASKIVQLWLAVNTNMTNQYVRGTLKYGNTEDSLFFIAPGEMDVTFRPVGYFRTSDVQHMEQPRVILYYGDKQPYTKRETGALWAKGGSYLSGGVHVNTGEAPSVNAPLSQSPVYKYVVQ